MTPKFAVLANETESAQDARIEILRRYGGVSLAEADVIVILGGDGFMLEALQLTRETPRPIYGMNRGTVGFLMNNYELDRLYERLAVAEETVINPLHMRARITDGRIAEALAINEVSLLRSGAQAAKLRIYIDGRLRMEELVCDGALVATPAGSTAYNYSAHGPILPMDAPVLALTAMAAFRPRRWRGAVLPQSALVRFEVSDPVKRPVTAFADSIAVHDVEVVEIWAEPSITHRILFDPGHGLEERLIREQFV